ncbi:MAG TPA: hypothetical protein VM821_04585 [Abditibacteriaceae bacterium]|nr:hypothetical protein [Abditibacteriaceae bacterium]
MLQTIQACHRVLDSHEVFHKALQKASASCSQPIDSRVNVLIQLAAGACSGRRRFATFFWVIGN